MADLSELNLPERVVCQLPTRGRARIIILTGMDEEDVGWGLAAYGEFLRDDTPEDAIYERSGNAVR